MHIIKLTDDSRNINRAQKPYGTHARLDSRKIIYANLSYGDRKNNHVLNFIHVYLPFLVV